MQHFLKSTGDMGTPHHGPHLWIVLYSYLKVETFDLSHYNVLHCLLTTASTDKKVTKRLVINDREGGLQNGKIAGPKLFVPPPPLKTG